MQWEWEPEIHDKEANKVKNEKKEKRKKKKKPRTCWSNIWGPLSKDIGYYELFMSRL